MSKHTPGPWTVRDLPTAQRYIGPSHDGAAPSVAFVLARVNVPDERLDADARLVAAAPCLFAALQDALSIFKFGEDDKTVVAPKWVARAEAAVLKATGVKP